MRTFPGVRRGIGSATPPKAGEAEGAKRLSTFLSLRQTTPRLRLASHLLGRGAPKERSGPLKLRMAGRKFLRNFTYN
jgi:hypothetical protein